MGNSKFLAPVSLSERLTKENEFFDKTFMMSYSGLNKLVHSPASFYHHYVLGQKEDVYDKNMIEGSLIHCLLLNPSDFEDQFVLSSDANPSENQIQVLHRLYEHYKELKASGDHREELDEFNYAITDILQDINLYQSMKPETRLAKMVNDSTRSYWEYLKKSEGRTVIDHDTHDFAKAVVEKITSNAQIMDLMGFFGDEMNGITMQNESELVTFLGEDLPFGIRGFLDNMVFDKQKKEIRINDLKKTGKELKSFTESIDYFRYWMQAAFYNMLVKKIYLSKPEYSDYKLIFRFIVVDPYMQIAPIKVTDETMKKWEEDTMTLLAEASYHFNNKNFELPYQFLINKEFEI
jgi:hypothetical protein